MTNAIITIDCQYIHPERACAFLIIENGRAAFVDNNTPKAVPLLMAALDEHGLAPDAVDYAIITHVHLDHASGTAPLLERCPNAQVLAHPKAARHLAKPERLIAAARQVYGDHFDSLYGGMGPVDEDRIRVMDDGEQLTWGSRTLEFFYTLGHASHHMCIHDDQTESVFAGDSFGITYPSQQSGHRPPIFVAATPTEFDPAPARTAVDQIMAFKPKQVHLTHFGSFGDVAALAHGVVETTGIAEAILDEAVQSSLGDEELESWIHNRLKADTHAYLKRCGLPQDDQTLTYFDLDIHMNTQGILATATRRRRKRDTE
jgi:glyoxylase-like metal-dependent hydrolase (beta-lactamase superfamily II)